MRPSSGTEPERAAVEALGAYFSSGEVVCPYARTAEYVFFGDRHFYFSFGGWLAAMAGRAATVVVASPADRSFEEARRWVLDLHARLCHALGHEPVLHRGQVLPHVGEGAVAAYTIGMGPQYPPRHPRYAPHLCLVGVSAAAVREVPEFARGPIRRAMFERAGAHYDADEVWLPIVPVDQWDRRA